MPQIVIDGIKIETSQNKTVIEAAYENGLQIPHFCWHPELSISGNCRMCLVEVGLPKRMPDGSFAHDEKGNISINYMPKLQIACATYVADGMHIRTNTEKVLKAREAVMEFLLINHPLDCPICDEAGECKLQEYAFKHSKGYSRLIDLKNSKPKRQEWGPYVMYDAERCILCSRCIRYAKEIANQDILTFVNRNDKVTIEVEKNKVWDNPYSMNVIEICPVGALTSRDFRFKARVWDMSFNDSICPGCARGCNIKLGVRNNEILRIEPRTNPYVNRYWLCDYGRLTQYQFVNQNRINKPYYKEHNNFIEIKWDEVLKKVSNGIKNFKSNEIFILASARNTNEDNYLLQQFAKSIIKTDNIGFLEHNDETFGDDFLRKNDKTPNKYGLESLGIKNITSNYSDLIEKIKFGQIKCMIITDNDISDYQELIDELDNLDLLITIVSNYSTITEKSNYILPASTYAEIEGTFTNFEGRVQHLEPAITTYENLRIMGMKMSRLDKFGALNDRWTQHELRYSRPLWKIIQNIANHFAANWNYKSSKNVFDEISNQVDAFKSMDYELLDTYQGLKLFKAENPDPKVVNYRSHVMKLEGWTIEKSQKES